MELCALDVTQGADVLDICLDGVASDGSNRGSKILMSKFTALCEAEERVAKAPFMICASEWNVVKEGGGSEEEIEGFHAGLACFEHVFAAFRSVFCTV